jgi:glycerol-3-phosphate dehydrogenase (NAD(P)+)
MNISVLGCGRWGSFIAWYLNKIRHNVTLWGRECSPHLKHFIENGNNGVIYFDGTVKLTSSIEGALSTAELIVISISAQSLRSFMESLCKFDFSGKIIVLCMKGVEEVSGKRLTEVVKESINISAPQVAVWVGPGHVQDFLESIPNCMVIDCESKSTAEMLIGQFSGSLIRFYCGNDLIGNEIGAAAKNVMGIAAGILDGIGYSSLKGALMSRGTREISRLIEIMGGNPFTAYGLCHLGDYQATLFSPYSNNRQYGESLVKNQDYKKLAEGVATCNALCKLGVECGADLPICNSINSIVRKKADPKKEISNLFLRPLKSEFSNKITTSLKNG